MTNTTTLTTPTLDELREAVWNADSAWALALDDPAAKAAYKAAKKSFRDAETKAIECGATDTCHRCGGEGGWRGWPGFTCYNCAGSGREPLRKTKFQAEPPTRAKRQAERQAEVDARSAVYAEQIEKLGEVGRALVEARAAVDAYDGYTDEPLSRETYFRAELASKLFQFGSLSEKQIAAVRSGLDRELAQAEAKAAAGPLDEGRYAIEGEVVSGRYQDSQFGSTYKILVKLDNDNKVWGTCPRALDGKVGDRVVFTATVERSGDDEHFGFFSRPKVGR